MVIQSQIDDIYQSEGYVGTIARPVPQACFEEGRAHVPSGGTSIKPGFGLVYDQSENKFKEPTTTAEELAVVGVCSYDLRAIPTTLATTPTNSNSNQSVEFADDKLLRVCIEGVMYLKAGQAIEFGDLLRFDRSADDWVKITAPTAVSGIPRLSVVCLSKSAADGDLFHGRITLAPSR